MIGIEGQYTFNFSLEGEKNFISISTFESFKVVEEAGNTLPTFQFAFKCYDENIIKKLNEGCLFSVSFGASRDKLKDTRLNITKLSMARLGEEAHLISVVGLLSNLGYLNIQRMRYIAETSAISAMEEVVEEYFDTDFSGASVDSQVWLQGSITDRSFVNSLWLHADMGNSFPLIAISMDGTFIFRDARKLAKEEPKWIFTNTEKKDKDIIYDSDYAVESVSGLMNCWAGYGMEKLVIDMDSGTSEKILEHPDSFLALTSKLPKRKDIENKVDEVGFVNENVHENFWKSYNQNISNLATFGNIKVSLAFSGFFRDIRVLDLVMLRDDEVGSNKKQSSENHSGLYFVSKVVRSLDKNQFVTIVELNREAFNQNKGELR